MGLITFLPAYLGAEPCTASKIATSLPMLALGANPSPPISALERSLQDVAVHVGGDDHLELLGSLHQLVRGVVDDHVPRLDLRILRRDLLEDALQRALAELHDVGLGGACHAGAAFAARVLEREPAIFSQPFTLISFSACATPGVCMYSMPA